MRNFTLFQQKFALINSNPAAVSKDILDQLEASNYDLQEKLLDIQFQLEEAKIQKSILESELIQIENPELQQTTQSLTEDEQNIFRKLNSLKICMNLTTYL